MSAEPPQSDKPEALAYRMPRTPDDLVDGELATTAERFFAGVTDWFANWIGLAVTSIAIASVSPGGDAPYAYIASWFTMHYASDAFLGKTVGRALSRMAIANAKGHRPTRGQLFLRATIQKLWYWPMMVFITFMYLYEQRFVHFSINNWRLVTMALWLSGLFWLINCVSSPKTHLTLADRISRTRVLVRR